MEPKDPPEQEAFTLCTPRELPKELWDLADQVARGVEPTNQPPNVLPPSSGEGGAERAAVDRRRCWNRTSGVHLTVGFLDNPEPALRAKILSHMNAWSKTANVRFTETGTDPQVRIARMTAATAPPGKSGFWSYVGTDVLLIPKDEPTMNLGGFTMNTPDSEFFRVVRHETGHTLGFPHEHMRGELVNLLDPEKVIAEFMRTQGWSRQKVIDQVLTPLEESSLLGTQRADANSIMCYQIPAFLTKNGKAIAGGTDIDDLDYDFVGKIYPKS